MSSRSTSDTFESCVPTRGTRSGCSPQIGDPSAEPWSFETGCAPVGEDETLSAQVNTAVRVEVERRARLQLLQRWLDELDQSEGPVDEALIATFEELLS